MTDQPARKPWTVEVQEGGAILAALITEITGTRRAAPALDALATYDPNNPDGVTPDAAA